MSKTFKRILIGFVIIVSFVSIFFGFRIIQIIRTEKNTGDILKSIMQIEFNKKDVVRLNEYSYITKSDIKYMKSFLKKSGWEFEEQLGSGYSFINSNGERLLLIIRFVFGNRYFIFVNDNKVPIAVN